MVQPEALLPVDYSRIHSDLDLLVANVDDVTEPSSIDNILEYAEQIQEEDEKFMKVLTQKLHNAVVYWEQPWYQQQNILGHRHKTLEDNGSTTSYRTDTICKEERDMIAKNWRKFTKRYGIPDKIICFARWRNLDKPRNPTISKEEHVRRFITSYLARGLKRNTHQVYQHIKSYYAGYTRGNFSAAEEKVLEICFHHKPSSIGRILSTVLGREPRSVNKRLQGLRNEMPEKKRLKWNLTRATKLVQAILKHSGFKLDELKNRIIEKSIWRNVGEEMDQNDNYLQHFWYCYLHVQLFVKCDVKLTKLRKSLFKKLRMKARANVYQVWSDIRWNDITLEFPDGFTPRFLYRICNIYVINFKGYLRAPLADVVDNAFEKIKKDKKMKRNNKRLKSLRLNEEGKLEVVNYKS